MTDTLKTLDIDTATDEELLQAATECADGWEWDEERSCISHPVTGLPLVEKKCGLDIRDPLTSLSDAAEFAEACGLCWARFCGKKDPIGTCECIAHFPDRHDTRQSCSGSSNARALTLACLKVLQAEAKEQADE